MFYIQPPEMEFQAITILKNKRKRIERVRKKDVPLEYRKNKMKRLKKQIDELKWQTALITEHIRKVMQNDYQSL